MGDDLGDDLGLGGDDTPGDGPVPQDAMDQASSEWDAYNFYDPVYQERMESVADGSADLDAARDAANREALDSYGRNDPDIE